MAGSRHSRVCVYISLIRSSYLRITAKQDGQNAQKHAEERGGSVASPQKHKAEHPEVRLPISNGVVSGPPPEVESEAGAPSQNPETSRDSAAYQPEMDKMRCILYAHGGMEPLILSCWFNVLQVCTRWLLLWQLKNGKLLSFAHAIALLGLCHHSFKVTAFSTTTCS